MGKKVVFLGMGGTIAGRSDDASDNVGYKAGQVRVEDLLRSAPGLALALNNCAIESEQVAQMDSSNLNFAHWVHLAERVEHHLESPEVVGVVVTHGTDTLEETAYFLSRVLPRHLLSHKAVVLTCAMRPASSSAPDGPGNLRDAVAVAVCPGAMGVVAVCAGRIHSGWHIRKAHPYRLDPFDSGDVSPLGFVEEGRVRMLLPWNALDTEHAAISWPQGQALPSVPWVEMLTSHAAASGRGVRAWCASSSQAGGIAGIVVACTGNGTLHQELNEALQFARQQGVRVVRVSRCHEGQIVVAGPCAPGVAPPPVPLTGAGEFEVWPLSALKARLELVLQLMRPAQG